MSILFELCPRPLCYLLDENKSFFRYHRHHSNSMTHEELTVKAVELAKRWGIAADSLQKVGVREVAIVCFRDSQSSAIAEFYLDRMTGDFISASFSGPEFTTKMPGMPLSKEAREVLALASEESRRLGCKRTESWHLLLAALAFAKGAGVGVLSNAGLSLGTLRKHLAAAGTDSDETPSGYASSLRDVLRSSCEHAKALGHEVIEPDHLILALLDEAENGVVGAALRHFRVDLAQAKRRLVQALKSRS